MSGRGPATRRGRADVSSDAAAGARTDLGAMLSQLPSVDSVLAAASPLALYSHSSATTAVRDAIAALRERVRGGAAVTAGECSAESVAADAVRRVEAASKPKVRRVVNATGVVLHTNLGRARLAEDAIRAVVDVARGACNLEYDLERGRRGDRDDLVEEHLRALTGAEAATVVNNNAAAVVLALTSLAAGREVVVSRGELVEIGGSFRIPDIMAASGARLREVGTTNRTHPADYRDAIGPETALVMKVHTSNYRIVGFAASVGLGELSAIAKEKGLPLVEDLGSGAIVDLGAYGLASEPVLGDRLAAGADLVLASGDKLLGGPQCGIVVGRADLVAKMKRHPLKRALRCDKLTLAALEATLRLYRFSPDPAASIPTLASLRRPVEDLRRIGEAAIPLLVARLGAGFSFELVASEARAGSGSWSDVAIASIAIAVRAADRSAAAVEKLFRSADPPVIGRIDDDVFLLDLCLIDEPGDVVPGAGPA